jgi:hypothetical protein
VVTLQWLHGGLEGQSADAAGADTGSAWSHGRLRGVGWQKLKSKAPFVGAFF